MGSFAYHDASLLNHYFSFCQLTYFWKDNCQDPIFKLSRCSVFGYTVHKRYLTIISHEPPLFSYVTFLFSLFLFSFISLLSWKKVSEECILDVANKKAIFTMHAHRTILTKSEECRNTWNRCLALSRCLRIGSVAKSCLHLPTL